MPETFGANFRLSLHRFGIMLLVSYVSRKREGRSAFFHFWHYFVFLLILVMYIES